MKRAELKLNKVQVSNLNTKDFARLNELKNKPAKEFGITDAYTACFCTMFCNTNISSCK